MVTPFIPLILSSFASPLIIESRTLLTGEPTDPKTSVILNQRIVADGKITRVSRTVNPDRSLSFGEETFTLDGTPVKTVQEGYWNDRWNEFSTTFNSRGAKQSINGEINLSDKPAKFFRDPTVTWFWREKPKVGTVVTVNYLAQNVIAIFQLRFTYEADETMTLAGKTVPVHRVRENPLSAPKGVYSIYWYDDAGMIVKRFHKTTTSEFGYTLSTWR